MQTSENTEKGKQRKIKGKLLIAFFQVPEHFMVQSISAELLKVQHFKKVIKYLMVIENFSTSVWPT